VDEAAAGRLSTGDRIAAARTRIAAAQVRLGPLVPALRLLGFAAAVAIVVYIGVRAARDVHPRDLALWPLPLALVGAATWWLLLARGWSLLVSGRTTRQDVSVWCRTQALRFLPGGLWAPASRVVAVKGRALDRLSTVAGENVLALSAAATVGGAGLAGAGRPWWGGLVATAAVPPVVSRVLDGRIRVTPARSVRALLNYLVAFVAYGLAAVLVQGAVSGFADPLAVAGASSLAWAAGLVVVIAPSGVGVRELVYVELLSGTLPDGQLAAAAVTMRLTMIVAELGVLLLAGRPALEGSLPVADA
jgi:hypothetical protein